MTAVKRPISSHANTLQEPILRLLWNGGFDGWHDIDEIMSVVGPLVPPGKAFRVAERQRVRSNQTRNGTEHEAERQRGNDDAAVLYGKRTLIVQTLASMRESGWIEIEYDDPTKKRKAYKAIRLIPDLEPIFRHRYDPGLPGVVTEDGAPIQNKSQLSCSICGQRSEASIHKEQRQ